jgi:RNA polymerase subunit RPABC4/transcription elongation factor Spt4
MRQQFLPIMSLGAKVMPIYPTILQMNWKKYCVILDVEQSLLAIQHSFKKALLY